MSLSTVLQNTFERSLALHGELVNALPDGALERDLPGLPSNSIGLQLWCVVGARESYTRALENGTWSGFSCSLEAEQVTLPGDVAAALASSSDAVLAALSKVDDIDDARSQLALDLLEHEAAHHGQLIRYVYALGLPIPDGWKQRYALS